MTIYFALSRSRPLKALGALLLLNVLGALPSAGQGLATESFQATTTSNYSLTGSAVLTAATGEDPAGSGYLRLTEAVKYQAGYAMSNNTFPATQGFSISFEFFSYGTKDVPADGFSVFLVDGDKSSPDNFAWGQTGGSLGYVGLSYAYLGIGIDEYGNFSSPDGLRMNGPGRRPQSIALRGAGDGYQYAFPYLGGTKTLPYSLSVGTARAQAGSPDYRRVFINAVPQNGAFVVTVRIQHGDIIETVVDEVSVPVPPTNLRVGLAGSTGDLTGVHEIRKLEVARAPLLRQDSTSTRQGLPVAVNVLSNDLFSYIGYAPGTVDLDIVQPGIQSTLTLEGKGTLSVNQAGVVTFTPLNSFSGSITVPYSAKDQVGQDGTPSNLKVTIDAAAPLAVVLTSFSVAAQEQNAILRWTTSSELNSSHFVVKRSLDGQRYVPIASVQAHGSTSQSNSYSFIDKGIAAGLAANVPVYYVLEEVETTGKTSASPVRVITFQPGEVKISLFPNPITSSATLDLLGLASGQYQVEVLTMTGSRLNSYSLAGQRTHTLDLAHLTPGAYLLRVSGAGITKSLPLFRL